MSIDFDSAALQTQHDEEEYDPEDYAREQELHKLLTDLPDDMLEDSRDSSSPELEYSPHSDANGDGRQSPWPPQSKWTDHQKPASFEKYGDDYNQGSSHNEYAYKDGAVYVNGHGAHPQSNPPPATWHHQPPGCQYPQGVYEYTGAVPERATESSDFSTNDFPAEGFEHEQFPHGVNKPSEYDQGAEDQGGAEQHFQNFDYPRSGTGKLDPYKATYIPHKPASQPQMLNPQAPRQEGHFDHLQREYLDSAQDTVEGQQLAQLQILNKAQQRQIEDLERKLEDSRRNMRYVEHQFAIVKDEKDGIGVSLKESGRLLEEAKEKEAQMQKKIKILEQQVQSLTERDHENLKKQRIAEAAVDSVKQQMAELCRSETLSRTREQHDRDLSVQRQQHEAALLILQQQLDASAHALKEQMEVSQRLREQVKQLERQREDEQVERAGVVNTLSQHLEESQQQCAKLLQTGSVQEMSQMQIKLQQAQSAKTLSENMNQELQENLADLKEQITLYESAVKHGVITLDLSENWEKQLSESYADLGIKQSGCGNGRIHSTLLTEPKAPQDEVLRELRAELQRCLTSLKGKRQRIVQLQEELQRSQSSMDELQRRLVDAERPSEVMLNHLDVTGASQKELLRLQQEKHHFQEQVESLERKNQELRQSEEKVRSANTELCTKMREMIQELDQEKQEAAERYERVQQQYRDDVVNRVRTELELEHQAETDQLMARYQQQIQQLQDQLSEATDKMAAVQECYISICKEKEVLEEKLCSRENEEAAMRENQLKMKKESGAALVELRAELEAEHQASLKQLKALWMEENASEIQEQVASAKALWKEEQEQMEQTWAQRLDDIMHEKQLERADGSCQTDGGPDRSVTVSLEGLESRLASQKHTLQLEADEAKRRAVEEVMRRAQAELQEKHLEELATQVEGAVTRAYSRWVEDLTSLPEYTASLQREKDKWEEEKEKVLKQKVSQAFIAAEEQWQENHRSQLEEQRSGAQRVERLQEEVVSLQGRLERLMAEQAALLMAELAAARAVWNRDKQQEMSSILQELKDQRRKQEECTGQLAERERLQRRRAREEFLTELQGGLAELRSGRQMNTESARASATSSNDSVAQIVQSAYRELLAEAVGQAKKEWRKISDEKLSCVLKETLERHKREISGIQSAGAQQGHEPGCGQQCTEAAGRLQKKNRDLQKHLEKACRQLQQTVRENKSTLQRLNEEHELRLRKLKEEHLLQLEEVKHSKDSSGSSSESQALQLGLGEMKQQYLDAVEKIRGDMLRYLQDSKQRAAEMIRVEVQRERQDTTRKMRRYYMACLKELLEHGEQTPGAEKKIMSAAGKLLAMAKVLETPVKNKPGRNHSAQSSEAPGRGACFGENSFSGIRVPEIRPDERNREHSENSHPRIPPAARTGAGSQAAPRLGKPGPATPDPQRGGAHVSLRSGSRELYLRGADCGKADDPPHPGSHGKAARIRETPVRDGGRGAAGGAPSLAQTGREPLSLRAASPDESGEFGPFGPDLSDVTVYPDLARRTTTPHSRREPIPGSEVTKGGGEAGYSELRQRQQDSGFDSPFAHLK